MLPETQKINTKMKIAFYYPDDGLPDIDYRRPDLGNPGVGGTHYCILLLVYYLKLFEFNYEIIVYCHSNSIFPIGIITKKIEKFDQVVESCLIHNVSFLVMKHETSTEIFNIIQQSNLKIIFWGHNFYLSDLADNIAKTKNIVANVFVGKQQYDRYIDHPICSKSTVIFNMITDPLPFLTRNNDSKTVVYMGALIPSKGFLHLAKLWKGIVREVPNAKLKVIGTGSVYSRDLSLGSFNLADKDFESQFMPHLCDDKNQLIDSVEFLGLLGTEKYDVFKNASVGVINPSGRTEIFSMSVMEMAAAKLPVVTLNANGFPDSIENGKTGFLCNTQNGIAEKIILLLKNANLNQKFGDEAKIRIKQFSPEAIVPKWITLFEKLNASELATPYLKPSIPLSNNLKWLRILNRILRINCNLPTLTIIKIETLLYYFLIRLKKLFK